MSEYFNTLPPLPNYPSSTRRLSPLEPTGAFHTTISNHHGPQHQYQHNNHGVPSTSAYDIDIAPILSIPAPLDGTSTTPNKTRQRALGSTSPQSIRKILDCPDVFTHFHSGRRRRDERDTHSDFVQLPQPPKQLRPQKQAKQAVPPIIIGLHNVPPQQTIFPPIASSSFHDSHGRNTLNVVSETSTSDHFSQRSEVKRHVPIIIPEEPAPPKDAFEPATKGKTLRRKFTDAESSQLLLGVKKHGAGKWSIIIKDPEFTFNNRTAVDLKDRFRVLRPTEMGGKLKSRRPVPKKVPSLTKAPKQVDDDATHETTSTNLPKSRKMRKDTERKDRKDLLDIGIEDIKTSSRRKVIPFTTEEDIGLLRGFVDHGNQWAKIQKDPAYGLAQRSRCDLRDRMRYKHPDKFHAQSSKTLSTTATKSHEPIEPSPTSSQENTRLPHPQNPSFNLPSLNFPPYDTTSHAQHLSQNMSKEALPKFLSQPLSFSELLSEDIGVGVWEVGKGLLEGGGGSLGDMNIANLLG